MTQKNAMAQKTKKIMTFHNFYLNKKNFTAKKNYAKNHKRKMMSSPTIIFYIYI